MDGIWGDQPALEAVCSTLEGKTEKQKNPSSHRISGLRDLGLRPAPAFAGTSSGDGQDTTASRGQS